MVEIPPLDAGEGPAERLDEVAAERIVNGALSQWEGAAPKRRRRRGVVTAALGLSLGLGSAAALYVAQQASTQPDANPSALAARQHGGQPAVELAPPPSPAPSEPVEPDEPATKARRPVGDLLARANELRGEGRYRAAEQTYLRVVRQRPRSSTAYVARIAAADLRLQHLNDPHGALQLYRQAARATDAALAIEAHVGEAKAHRRLGRTADEATVLRSLLAEHDKGPSADWARRRLAAIEAQP